MLVYVYDGSFEGLLTAVYEAYYRKQKPERLLPEKNLQSSFLDEYIHIVTDMEKSNRVYDSIRRKISAQTLENIYHVYLSDDPEAGTLIYNYLRLGWKIGGRIELHLSEDCVFKVHRICQRVTHETHKMMGFVRFQLVEGNIYYAPIEPDNNIVELLAPHFADRLADQNWVIHDVRREVAAVYNRSEWVLVNSVLEGLPAEDEKEKEYRELWKEFFNTITISNRFNPQLQKRLMPVRYWRHLTEMW